ncbi:ABC transporter substrate-binding protein [Plantactinospora sp. GCM10030261]|uniref:ABC transporter substrate-binding protein n=1 Tax=Plantactinospora sp. GCM10030261 TaxID=3273420 RepID=UPI0036138D1E
MSALVGMTWNHPRGVAPLLAATRRTAAEHPGRTIRWEARSLREFEDVPVAELAARYDLIAVDHPFVGQAAASGAVVPLDEVLPAEVLADLREASVGPSFRSYTWQDRQWALPMDAAAQVSAYRPDLLSGPPPASWDEVIELLTALPNRSAARLPASPTHLWASFLTLCHQHAARTDATLVRPRPDGRPGWWTDAGVRTEVAVPAIGTLYRLLDLVDPVSLTQDPITTLDAMAAGAPVRYVPLTFGYSNYARDDHARHLVRFADAPSATGNPDGSMLGGVGLAISARCRDLPTAARFAALVLAADFQRGDYLRSGGQPGHRAAWTDPAANDLTHDFFRATLSTVDNAFVRARDVGYPAHQRDGGELLHALVRRREPAATIVAELADRWIRRAGAGPAGDR